MPFKALIKMGKALFGVSLALTLALTALLAFPNFLFAHTVTTEKIAIYSDRPFDHAAAIVVADDIEARLATNGFGLNDGTYALFVANTPWRRALLWNVIAAPDAGGFVAFPFSRRNAFLSGSDFQTNTLFAPDGTRITPPRTLSYYGAHELAHVVTGERLGAVRYLALPTWIKEGLADYVALDKRLSYTALREVVRSEPNALPLWKSQGYYARYRLLVQYYLEERGWSVDQLLTSGLSLDEAVKAAGLQQVFAKP